MPLSSSTRRLLLGMYLVWLALSIVPGSTLAKDGGSRGGHSESHGHGSADSGHGRSADDKGGGRGGDDSRRGSNREHGFKGGWREKIQNGNYEILDPAGRLVIRRKATIIDYLKF